MQDLNLLEVFPQHPTISTKMQYGSNEHILDSYTVYPFQSPVMMSLYSSIPKVQKVDKRNKMIYLPINPHRPSSGEKYPLPNLSRGKSLSKIPHGLD